MAHSNILVVCEGNSEDKFFKKMGDLFVAKRSIDCYKYNTNLYLLYDELVRNGIGTDFAKDEFDTLTILKNIARSPEEKELLSKKFELIYLCFDADFQAEQFDKDKIEYMLDIFDNDSLQGQIMINYTMFESLYDTTRYEWESFQERIVVLDGLTSATYTALVSSRGLCSPAKSRCMLYMKEQFLKCLKLNLSKARYLIGVEKSFDCVQDFYDNITQKAIFESVLSRVLSTRELWVLNTGVFFLVDYVGESAFENLFY